ncbi:hypothetical protein MSG28_013863 [Choristoneura fumiferana]|uniref:Uncharacterized protein n=1 Tax=Choristoneura fumiferana TaxID=7141 RepID=A0ACC0K988_CHOFU|nr:hypothetical protein MSG28_013863 [Choristoneura fumiferana]
MYRNLSDVTILWHHSALHMQTVREFSENFGVLLKELTIQFEPCGFPIDLISSFCKEYDRKLKAKRKTKKVEVSRPNHEVSREIPTHVPGSPGLARPMYANTSSPRAMWSSIESRAAPCHSANILAPRNQHQLECNGESEEEKGLSFGKEMELFEQQRSKTCEGGSLVGTFHWYDTGYEMLIVPSEREAQRLYLADKLCRPRSIALQALWLSCVRAVTLAACKDISYNLAGRWPAMRPSFVSTRALRHAQHHHSTHSSTASSQRDTRAHNTATRLASRQLHFFVYELCTHLDRQFSISKKHLLEYVLSSVPHTGSYSGGQTRAQPEYWKRDRQRFSGTTKTCLLRIDVLNRLSEPQTKAGVSGQSSWQSAVVRQWEAETVTTCWPHDHIAIQGSYPQLSIFISHSFLYTFSSDPQTTFSFCPEQSVAHASPPDVRSCDTQNAIGTSKTCLLKQNGTSIISRRASTVEHTLNL